MYLLLHLLVITMVFAIKFKFPAQLTPLVWHLPSTFPASHKLLLMPTCALNKENPDSLACSSSPPSHSSATFHSVHSPNIWKMDFSEQVQDHLKAAVPCMEWFGSEGFAIPMYNQLAYLACDWLASKWTSLTLILTLMHNSFFLRFPNSAGSYSKCQS